MRRTPDEVEDLEPTLIELQETFETDEVEVWEGVAGGMHVSREIYRN